MVKCPVDVHPGDRIVVSAPSSRATASYSACVPKGIHPGDQFVVLVKGQPNLVTCPPGVGEGMPIKVLAPKHKDETEDLSAPFGETKFQVPIPEGVTPGTPFALIANGQKVILTCPQTAAPGSTVEFMVPVSKSAAEVRAVKLSYEKEGWVRCLTPELTFQWLHQTPRLLDASEETGGRMMKEKIDSMAFVRELSKTPEASLGESIALVDATQATSSTLVDGRTMAIDIAKHVNAPFQTKEAWFRGKVSGLQIPWEEGHIRINIRRSNLLVDAMEAFESIKKEDLRKTFRFEFVGEPGIDAGGVSREFYQVCEYCDDFPPIHSQTFDHKSCVCNHVCSSSFPSSFSTPILAYSAALQSTSRACRSTPIQSLSTKST
jgi:hypothetical protein